MITVLAGGTGSIKLIRGLASQHCSLKVISNVADNIWLYGLYICPDIDTVIYGLAGMLDSVRGWGIRNDSFQCLHQMEMLGEQTWFKIGDRDLATHLLRTMMLKNGKCLSYITEWIRRRYFVSSRVIPATDDPIETRVLTDRGEMHIQEFWVKHMAEPTVFNIRYNGIENARINPEVIQAIRQSKLIVIPPANPVSSIGPILAIRGLKKVLVEERKKIVGVSPLIGNRAVSGPAIKYMEAMNLPTTPFGIAQSYSDFLTKFVISKDDGDSSEMIEGIGVKVYQTDILMKSSVDENRLASYLLTQT
ncbi:MAG TPA: 2-phospho-L-lactate transferase [Candidatus Bathyarchaeia archaeon]|nr:2-phospho-L-lactate transferase [Candidatus Bathyarchaeia archaeon]